MDWLTDSDCVYKKMIPSHGKGKCSLLEQFFFCPHRQLLLTFKSHSTLPLWTGHQTKRIWPKNEDHKASLPSAELPYQKESPLFTCLIRNGRHTIAIICRGNKTIDSFITRLNLEIKLWPVKGNHSVRIPLSQSEYDAVSIWLRSSEIEVIVWAKYCPPVDTTQLLLTPLTVSCVPSYIKAITSSKGKPGQSSLQDCIMDQLWEALSRHIMKEN